LLAACPRQTSVWARSGSSADRLILEFGRSRNHQKPISLGFLRVDRCEVLRATPGVIPPVTSAVWYLEGIPGATRRLSSLRYGEAPPGYSELRHATPLEHSGCYVVAISGTGVLGFEIDGQGRVIELDEAALARRTQP
jgi:hypothetical protein